MSYIFSASARRLYVYKVNLYWFKNQNRYIKKKYVIIYEIKFHMHSNNT